MRKTTLCLFAIWALVSCDKYTVDVDSIVISENTSGIIDSNNGQDITPEPAVKSSFGPIVMTEAQKEMALSVNGFGLSLLSEIIKDKPAENFVISPVSLAINLAICANGAEGSTANEIKDILGFKNINLEDVNSYFQTLTNGMATVDSLSEFSSANSIWADCQYPLQDSFIKNASEFYAADATNVDFSSSEAWDRIDIWCKENTKGLIDNMPRTDGTRFTLLNAVYFNGLWGHKFDSDLKKEAFHGVNGDTESEFLTSENRYGYLRMNTCRLLSIPYGAGGYSFLIAYPFDGTTFQETLDEISSQSGRIQMTRTEGYLKEIKVQLPKFKIEGGEEHFIKALKSMGMNLPFSDNAEFAGISENGFTIDDIIQKACIDVNENGTEAASVTEIVRYLLNPGSSAVNDSEFIVNSPFMFFVMEAGSGNILFAGQKVK